MPLTQVRLRENGTMRGLQAGSNRVLESYIDTGGAPFDDFNRADNASMGAPWVARNTVVMRITGNRAVPTADTTDVTMQYGTYVHGETGFVQAKMRCDNGFAGIQCLITTPFRNEVEMIIEPGGDFRIVEHNNGAEVVLDSQAGAGDVEYLMRLEWEIVGATTFLRGYVDGVLTLEGSTTNHVVAGGVGISSYRISGTLYFDDFLVGTIAPVAAPGPVTVVRPQAFGWSGEVDLTWVAPTTGGTPTSTVIQRSTDGTTWTTHTGVTGLTATGATLTGLTLDTRYVFRVAVANDGGTSAYATSEWGATPKADAAPLTWPTGTLQSSADWALARVDKRTIGTANFRRYFTGAGVRIYHIDSGVRGTHNEFDTGRTGATVAAFTPAGGGGSALAPTVAHGTMTASKAVGATLGVAPGADLWVLQAWPEDSWTATRTDDALQWIIDNHPAGTPAVVTSSTTFSESELHSQPTEINPLVAQIVDTLGLLYVQCTGNTFNEPIDPLAARPGVIHVGAIQNDDSVSSFNLFDPSVDIFAPGGSVDVATIGSDTATGVDSGTSFGTPLVAGVVATWLEANPTLTPFQLQDLLLESSTKGAITGSLSGQPNRLLYSIADIPTPPVVAPALYSDYFDRANGNLTTPWVTIDGNNPISSNKVVVGSSNPNVSYYDETFDADQWAEADLADLNLNPPTVQGMTCLTLRVNSGDFYYFWMDGSRQVQINKRVGGSYTTVATGTALVPTGAFKVRMEAEGTTLRAYINGVLVLTTTDSSVAVGRPGILTTNGPSATLDNFRCGDLPYVPPTTALPDTFDRSDLHSSEYDVIFGTLDEYEIVAGNVRAVANFQPDWLVWNDTMASADQEVTAYVNHTVIAGGATGPIARIPSLAAQSGYAAWILGGGWGGVPGGSVGVALYRVTNESETQLGSTYTIGTSTGTFKVTVRCDGDQISVLVNDAVVIGPITDTTYAAAGYAGLRVYSDSSSNQSIASFDAQPYVAPVVSPTLASGAYGPQGGISGFDINKPTGLAVGDMMIVAMPLEEWSASPPGWTGDDAGWDIIGTQFYDAHFNMWMTLMWKIADAADVAASIFSFSNSGSAYTYTWIGRIVDHDGNEPVILATWGDNTGTGVNRLPAGATTEDGILVIGIGASWHNGPMGGSTGGGWTTLPGSPATQPLGFYREHDTAASWPAKNASEDPASGIFVIIGVKGV